MPSPTRKGGGRARPVADGRSRRLAGAASRGAVAPDAPRPGRSTPGPISERIARAPAMTRPENKRAAARTVRREAGLRISQSPRLPGSGPGARRQPCKRPTRRQCPVRRPQARERRHPDRAAERSVARRARGRRFDGPAGRAASPSPAGAPCFSARTTSAAGVRKPMKAKSPSIPPRAGPGGPRGRRDGRARKEELVVSRRRRWSPTPVHSSGSRRARPAATASSVHQIVALETRSPP